MNMEFIIIVAIIYLVSRMFKNYKHNQRVSNVIDDIERYGVVELMEIIEWETFLRQQLAITEIEFKRGQITEDAFSESIKILLNKRNEIQERFNITDEEMTEIYFNHLESARITN